MINTPLDAYLQLFTQLNLHGGLPLTVGLISQRPANSCVVLVQYNGIANQDGAYEQPFIQNNFFHENYATAKDMAWTAYISLRQQINQTKSNWKIQSIMCEYPKEISVGDRVTGLTLTHWSLDVKVFITEVN